MRYSTTRVPPRASSASAQPVSQPAISRSARAAEAASGYCRAAWAALASRPRKARCCCSTAPVDARLFCWQAKSACSSPG
ncbi:hypothetical protein ACFW9F_18665 [Streptomyces sp. NPDC059506]|uniref:hypothetical protein n=1 Tax=Streptomyces sp. NPDC059506 TaxID=3347751 RepID=UPI0036A0382B